MTAPHNQIDFFATASVPGMDHSASSSSSSTSNSVATSQVATPQAAALLNAQRQVKHKRRYCRYAGCTRIVKSQGLCQRHGAKPRKCRVSDCVKQAQGNFDGMCKSHFKAFKRETTPLPRADGAPTNHGMGSQNYVVEQQSHVHIESVYDHILPQSVAWHRNMDTPMPLIQHLAQGFHSNKPPAWHRNEERLARGLVPVHNAAIQLETWERELVWMEILALSGNPDASFRHLARAWGRDKGFHMVLAQFICERRGDVERKKRERQMGSNIQQDLTTVWDPDATSYGDAYDEALASDLLSFSQQVQGNESVSPFLQQRNGLDLQQLEQQQPREHRPSFDQRGEPSYSGSPISSNMDEEKASTRSGQSLQRVVQAKDGDFYLLC